MLDCCDSVMSNFTCVRTTWTSTLRYKQAQNNSWSGAMALVLQVSCHKVLDKLKMWPALLEEKWDWQSAGEILWRQLRKFVVTHPIPFEISRQSHRLAENKNKNMRDGQIFIILCIVSVAPIINISWQAVWKGKTTKTCDFIPNTQMPVWHLCNHLSPTTCNCRSPNSRTSFRYLFCLCDKENIGHWQTHLRTLRHKNVMPAHGFLLHKFRYAEKKEVENEAKRRIFHSSFPPDFS